MGAWPPDCYQRAIALVTDGSDRLLVFDHVGEPRAGTQVPAGGIKPGEDHEAAVLRELAEESGITSARVVRKLGETWFVAERGQVPAGLEEQLHHAFHLTVDGPAASEAWEWDECSDGVTALHRFAFRWVDLETASVILHPIQAMWLTSLAISLAAA